MPVNPSTPSPPKPARPKRTVDPRLQPALRAVILRYERPLISFSRRWVLNLATAQDIAQDTLLRLCQQPPETLQGLLSGEKSRLEGWLFVVARNLAIDVARRSGRAFPAGSALPARPAPGPTPAEAAAQLDLADRIIAMIDDLPPKQAEVIHLRFEQGLSYKAIADLTGLTSSYVGYLLHEGLKTLRQRAGSQTQQTRASA